MSAHFHLSFHVHDLDKTRLFYRDLLGCDEGRSTEHWIDFNFVGHQLSLHLGNPATHSITSRVDEHNVPILAASPVSPPPIHFNCTTYSINCRNLHWVTGMALKYLEFTFVLLSGDVCSARHCQVHDPIDQQIVTSLITLSYKDPQWKIYWP